jgi:hypothetical protein
MSDDDDYVVCIEATDAPHVPSKAVECCLCGCGLWISEGMIERGKPICRGCATLRAAQEDGPHTTAVTRASLRDAAEHFGMPLEALEALVVERLGVEVVD